MINTSVVVSWEYPDMSYSILKYFISILTYPHTVYSTIGETMNQPYAPENNYYAAPKQHDTVRVCI